MSIYTTLQFFRPLPPPSITANDLSRFIAAIRNVDVLKDGGMRSLNVKFGRSIDQDENLTTFEEETSQGFVVQHEIDWEIKLPSAFALQEMIDCLATGQRHVYRAHAILGTPVDDIMQPITHSGCDENKRGYYPDLLGFEVGPVYSERLDSEQPLFVGWLSLTISGYGHIFPWKFSEVVNSLENSTAVQRMMELCRSLWPVPQSYPDPDTIATRQRVGDLWPYDDFAKPWDWYWGLSET